MLLTLRLGLRSWTARSRSSPAGSDGVGGARRRSCASLPRLTSRGATVGDVAARHGAYRSLVFTWRRQARDGLLTADSPGDISPFVPVRLLDGPSQPVERPIPAPSPLSPAPSRTVEISLPGGSVVRVDQHVDARALRRILGAVRG